MLGFVMLSAMVVYSEACCTPKQWEMDGGTVMARSNGGGLSLSLTNCRFHYDAVSLRMAMTTGIFRNPDFKNLTIWDFDKRVMYQVDNRGFCQATTLENPFEPICTPEGSRVADHFVYGGGDQGTLAAATFEYDKPDYSGFVKMTEGEQSQDTCVPIISVNYDLSFMSFMTFENIRDGIEDPSVFDPPESCRNVFPRRAESEVRIHPLLNVPLPFRQG